MRITLILVLAMVCSLTMQAQDKKEAEAEIENSKRKTPADAQVDIDEDGMNDCIAIQNQHDQSTTAMSWYDDNDGHFFISKYNTNKTATNLDVGDVLIAQKAAEPIVFLTNDIERMRVQGDGKIGIGLHDPFEELDLSGEAVIRGPNEDVGLFITGSYNTDPFAGFRNMDENNFVSHGFDLTDTTLEPYLDDDLTLGSADYRWKEIYAANATINTSDGRLKKNVENINYGLKAIEQMRPVSYQWKKEAHGKVSLGFIAQEMEKIIPEAVVKSELSTEANPNKPDARRNLDDAYGIRYDLLIPILTKGIQELNAENKLLKAQMEQMQKDMEALKGK